jgi:hypothetical protein
MRSSPPIPTRRLLRTTRERAVRARADDRNRGRKRAQASARRRTSPDRPENRRADPSPTGTSIRACAPYERTTGRRGPPPRNRAARYRRLAGGANGRPQPAPGAPSSPARRPGRLAFYMGYCANRREDRVIGRVCPPSGRRPKTVRLSTRLKIVVSRFGSGSRHFAKRLQIGCFRVPIPSLGVSGYAPQAHAKSQTKSQCPRTWSFRTNRCVLRVRVRKCSSIRAPLTPSSGRQPVRHAPA